MPAVSSAEAGAIKSETAVSNEVAAAGASRPLAGKIDMGKASPKATTRCLALFLGGQRLQKDSVSALYYNPLGASSSAAPRGRGECEGCKPLFSIQPHRGNRAYHGKRACPEGSLSGSAGGRYTWVFCGAQSVQTGERGRRSHGPILVARRGRGRCWEAAIPDRFAENLATTDFFAGRRFPRFSLFAMSKYVVRYGAMRILRQFASAGRNSLRAGRPGDRARTAGSNRA